MADSFLNNQITFHMESTFAPRLINFEQSKQQYLVVAQIQSFMTEI